MQYDNTVTLNPFICKALGMRLHLIAMILFDWRT